MQMLQSMQAGGRRIQVQDVNSYHAMLACVAAGTYMCMLPESVLQLLQLPAGLTLLPAGSAVTQLIWRKDYHSPALDHLRQLLAYDANLSA
jgi:DNA-binding transcriptional LysR family regulator